MEPASPVIDLAVLSAQTGGDALLEREVLALFARRARADFDILGSAPESLRREVAHRMVGAARAVGAGAVAAEARAVEAGGADLGALAAAVEAACRFVDEHLARDITPTPGGMRSTGRAG
jgi:hypothetical protein